MRTKCKILASINNQFYIKEPKFRMMKVFVLLITICVINSGQSREISIEISDTTESTVINDAERDYYSEFDHDEYERQLEHLKYVKRWLILGAIAVSFIGSVLILIVLVHLKSKKTSRLMSLI